MQLPFPVNPSDPTQVFTTTITPAAGLIHSTFWQKVNPRLEVGAECQLLMTLGGKQGPGRRGGQASMGFKLDTVFATIRSMIDTGGRVCTCIEQKIAPGLAFSLSGELDYSQGRGGQGKIGFGFSLEA